MKHTSGCAQEGVEMTGAWDNNQQKPTLNMAAASNYPEVQTEAGAGEANSMSKLHSSGPQTPLSSAFSTGSHRWFSVELASCQPHPEAASLASVFLRCPDSWTEELLDCWLSSMETLIGRITQPTVMTFNLINSLL